jgi:acyl-[acyl-carrier-protein]-phospholipid O-acyltransferase/long-chain-fatty-acid--[acyl-carrier-protein] ligase
MKRSFWSLIVVQVQVLLNDNAAKLMLMALGVAVAPELVTRSLEHMSVHGHSLVSAKDAGDPALQAKLIKTVLAAVILLPFILFSPTAGWIADRFAKRDVIVLTMWAQFAIMSILLVALIFHLLSLAVCGLFLLGTQCAIFSPAKQGIIKEIVSPTKIGRAVGVVEVTAIASMLVGGLAGGALFDISRTWLDSPWHAAQVTMAVLTVLALVALIAGYQIQPTSAHTNQPFRVELFWEHFGQLRDVWREPPVRLCVLGISYFYGLAGALYLTLFEISASIHSNGGTGTASQTGEYAATLGLGIILGSVLVTRLTTHQVEIGLIPIGSAGLIGGAMLAGFSDPRGPLFLAALFGMGIAGAMFVVPLNAHLQEQVEPSRRGRILSANNLFVNLFGLFAVMCQYIISAEFNVEAHHQLFLYAIPTLAVTVFIIFLTPEGLLRLALGLLGRTFYRVRPVGLEALPATGGVLLLPNHISYIDVVVLQLACPRPIRYLVYDEIYQNRMLRWGMVLLGAIPISPKKARQGIETAVEALEKGEVVCLFPEGALTRTATLQKLNRGYELIARKARVPVMPVWLENVWGSVFSYYGGHFFWKWPRLVPLKVWIYFGAPMTGEEATAETVRRRLLDMSEAAFQARPELKSHLGYECIRGLRKHFFQPVITDAYANRTLKGGELLAVGMVFAKWLKENVPEKRVGVVLPPGLGATVANLGLMLANKVPVNLNFTAGRAANESAMARANIKRLITAPAMVDQVKDFPWIENRIDLATTLKSFSPKLLKRWGVLGLIAPAGLLARWLELPRQGDHAECALLFTSGSAGEPKGVVLTHRNIIANIAQIGAILAQVDLNSILGCLPVFHSFGFTVTLWWPLLGGPRVVTFPSPLDTPKLAEVIDKHQVELLLSTPTFLRSFLRKAKPEQMKPLKMIVTGAEKLPVDLIADFEAKFGIKICEGFGMTEGSPVIACNLPDSEPSKVNPAGVLGRRVGSVGRMVPGVAIRIRDPETNEDRTLFEPGMLWLRGANLFEGYLNDEKRTTDVLHDGWYKTGDVARLDEDGFLFIEGRLSRFSKIAGEMIPHLTVEQRIHEAWPEMKDGEGHGVVVLGVPDDKKGEALVLLTTYAIDPVDLRKRLTAAGLPSLWIPKMIKQVEALPLLATGKLDLRAAQQLAADTKTPVAAVT